MPKSSLDSLPEVFVSSRDLSDLVSREVKRGKLRKIASRLYTKNLSDPPEAIVKRHLWPIIALYYPDAVIADRTALENRPGSDGSIFVISKKREKTKLPGIVIHPRTGSPALETDRDFIGGLKLSSPARAYLENMRSSRSRGNSLPRTLTRAELEESLDQILRIQGESAANRIRDEARVVSRHLNLEKEFEDLDRLIGTLLGTKTSILESPVSQARKVGRPYDPDRVILLEALRHALEGRAPSFRTEPIGVDLATIAFFESYFSNFIEGTEFEIDEALSIVFQGVIPRSRPKDAHDVLGTYRLASSRDELKVTPRSFDDLVTILQRRHATIMIGRPECLPGQFKNIGNRAGSTTFVLPQLVIGTLEKGFEIYRSIGTPFGRAVFMMFFVSEVHPFLDGNGRTARIMMNSELVHSNESRFLIPIVYRNNYIAALKALTQNGRTDALIRVLDFAQRYVHSIDWRSLESARRMLESTHAFKDSNEAEGEGIRLVLP